MIFFTLNIAIFSPSKGVQAQAPPPNTHLSVPYPRHHVVLESHHDNVEPDDSGVCQVKVLATDERVKKHPRLGVVAPVGRLTQHCITRIQTTTSILTDQGLTVGVSGSAVNCQLWNSLPHEVTSASTLPVFCSRLKTYLFQLSFPTN